jgi:hypothetical protein
LQQARQGAQSPSIRNAIAKELQARRAAAVPALSAKSFFAWSPSALASSEKSKFTGSLHNSLATTLR